MYHGWIQVNDINLKENITLLKNFGVTLGEQKHAQNIYENCKIPDESLKKLDQYWMIKFIWGLKYIKDK